MEALAVISLAIQVGECAIRINNGIATILNAPEELSRLRRHVEALYGIVDSARILYDLGQKVDGALDERTTVCVYSALTECRNAAGRIEDLLNKATKARNQRSSLWRQWPRLWLIRYKDQVEKLEKDTDSAVLMLNLAMTLHQASIQPCLNNVHTVKPLGPRENNLNSAASINLLQETPDEIFVRHHRERWETDSSDINFPKYEKCIISKASSVYRYQTPLGTLSITKKSENWQCRSIISTRDSRSHQTADTYIYSVQPSFLSWYFELHATVTSLRGPEIGLRLVHVMDQNAEERLQYALYYNDLTQLKCLLGDGAVFFDSVNRRGQSLLLMAQQYEDDDAVTFLVRQGCPVENKNVQLCASEDSLDNDKFRLLYSRSDLSECTVDAIFPTVSGIMSSSCLYEWYIAQSWASTCLPVSEWLGSKLYVEAQVWAKLVHEDINNHLSGPQLEDNRSRCLYWENLMLQSIRRGADLHYLNEDKCTTFGAWVQSYHHLDVEEIIKEWLIILKRCNVNTLQYLRRETGLYEALQGSTTWKRKFIRKRTIQLHPMLENPAVKIRCQAWDHDQLPTAGLVLQEFVGFGDDEGFSPLLKYSRVTEREWKRFWPFSYAIALHCEGNHLECDRCSRYTRREIDLITRRDRKDNTTMRGGVCVVEEQTIMPGSWVH